MGVCDIAILLFVSIVLSQYSETLFIEYKDQDIGEGNRRLHLQFCFMLSKSWGANSDVILWMWDYFHRRMVSSQIGVSTTILCTDNHFCELLLS